MLVFRPVAGGLYARLRRPFRAVIIAAARSSTGATSRASVASVLSDVAAAGAGATIRAPIGGDR